MDIKRAILQQIEQDFFKGKIIVILGARQVGKSTLVKMLPSCQENQVLWLDGENADVLLLLSGVHVERLRQLTSGYKVVVIDEAQKIPQIGSVLKLFADYFKELQVIASASSAFELRNALNEPLTGRKYEYQLFPLSFQEMNEHHGLLNEIRQLPQRMTFGAYPEIVVHPEDSERLLRFLSDSYLYKDIFLFKGIKRPEKMLELLKLLAWQIGNEVNYQELSKTLLMDNQTIENYMGMLEQAFVIYKLPAFHTNQRKELKKSKKIYFNDLGIRNALINDFRPIEVRNDAGPMFENYIINELRKKNVYNREYANFYFWRDSDQREIDLVIEKNNNLSAIEIKWNSKKKVSLTKSFKNVYGDVAFTYIHKANYHEYISY